MNSLRSKVRPPSNKIIATAKEIKIGKKSPSALGSKRLSPSGPKRKPPSNNKTKVGRWVFLDKLVRKQPAPTAKQSDHNAELFPVTAMSNESIIKHLAHAKSGVIFACMPYDNRWDTSDTFVRRNIFNHHAACSNFRTFADGDIPKNFCPCAY